MNRPSIDYSSRIACVARWATALLFALLAIAFLWGGIVLIGLGGSPWYVFAGLSCAGVAFLFARRLSVAGTGLYWLFLIATAVWALVEAGFDGWALVARLAGPLVIGLVLLVPALWRRPLLGLALAAGLAIAIVATGVAIRAPGGSGDPAWSPAPASDWASWGHDAAGTRFADLNFLEPGAFSLPKDNNVRNKWRRPWVAPATRSRASPMKPPAM